MPGQMLFIHQAPQQAHTQRQRTDAEGNQTPQAPFAIGQRDVQAYNLKVRLHALQGQLYDADLGNPLLSFLGHFDLAFVFVVLAPLLTIGITFNVFSGEEEGGTWPLLRSQHTAPWRILARRYGLRAAVTVIDFQVDEGE